MPSQNNNIIKNLRGKHDPHYKLAARVEGLEKEIPLHFNELHKTLSKSFGLQRKTLVRVVALEKKVSESRGPKKQTQEQPLGDWGEEPVEWDRSGKSSSPEGKSSSPEGEDGSPEGEDGSPAREPKIKGPSKLMEGSPALGKESKVGKLANITRRVTIRLGKVEKLSALNAEKITKLKDITKLRKENVDKKIDKGGSSSGLVKSLEGINANVEGMLAILGDRLRFEKKVTSDERKRAEQAKRGASEKKLESKAFAGLQKIGEKVLAPVMSLWDKIVNFITTVFLGKVALKLFDWFTDPENEKKLKAIGRFFKDWWPALLTGFLVFGTGLGGVLATLTTMVVGFATTMVTTTIPSLIAAAKAMGPWGWAALAVLGTAAVISTQKKKVDKEVDKSVKEKGAVATVEALKKEQKDRDKERNPFQKFFYGTVMGEDAERKKQIERVEGMNKGGQVPGRGPNKDTVPAMLTPGEFVMSRDAVDKWGVDTLANMNAAGGGTNIPTLMGGYNKGGRIKDFDRSHYGTMGYQIGQIQPDTLVVSWEGFKEKSREHIGKGGPRGRDYDKFSEEIDYDMPGRTREKIKYKAGSLVGEETYEQDIAAIGVPDLREHKDELLARIHAIEGYEKVTIDDVIRSRVNMPLKQYLPILMSSDAQKATFAKQSVAHQKDKEIRGIKEGEGYSMGYDFNLGGLVQGLVGGGLVQKFAGGGKVKEATLDDGKTTIDAETGRTRASDAAQGFMRGVTGVLDWATFGIWDFDKRGNLGGGKHGRSGYGEDIGAQRDAAAQARLKSGAFKGYVSDEGTLDMDALLGKTPPTSVPGPPNKPTTTVAYDQTMMEQAAGGMPQPQMKLPQINASAMISTAKIATLGISV